MNKKITDFISANKEEMYKVLKDLCLIPAPSHHEEKRAEYIKSKLEDFGAEGVYIDSALNVIYPLNCENSSELTVFVAHTDTVFPDMDPLPYKEEEGKILCPGVGDDTASVAVLMEVIKFLIENGIRPEKGMLFVFNSCEEGLGDLKGTKQIFKDFEGRIERFFSLDSANPCSISDHCAGSHRYEVEAVTDGGHSYLAFGKENAIAELSKIINGIYNIKMPESPYRTTYNVGGISGGTSVNTIAQSAKMLCEYRSENKDCLKYMEDKFMELFENARSDKVQINVKKIGDRPCENIEDEKIEDLRKIIVPVIKEVTGGDVVFKSSSTDCNIPLSLGIPAICFGVYVGGGAHTREEWLYKDSILKGLEIAIKIALAVV